MPILNWKELQDILYQKQEGELPENNGEEWLEGWDRGSENAAEDYKNRLADKLRSENTREARYAEARDLTDAYREEKALLGMSELGDDYGAYRKDKTIPYDVWVNNPTDYRANSQDGWGKLGNAALKMGLTFGTTFIDNTLGVVDGILNGLIVDPIRTGKFTPIKSGVNNWTSRKMQEVQDWSERYMPNYRTQEELDDDGKWWTHMNENFWGDVVLKNLGFTLAAGASGKLYSGAFNKAKAKALGDAYKATVAASAGDPVAIGALEQIEAGLAVENPVQAMQEMRKAMKGFNKLDWTSMLIGGVGGATGESRIEALNAMKEFRDEFAGKNKDRYLKAKSQLDAELDALGDTVTAADRIRYAEKLTELQKDYNDAEAMIDEQAYRLGNWTFGLNWPFLALDNMIVFGRAFSGGFNTQARFSIKGSFGKYLEQTGLERAASEAVKSAFSEGAQEVAQKVFSESQKDISAKNMAAFYNASYDDDAIEGAAKFLLSMQDSLGNVLGDRMTWQEFAVGALTGMGSSIMTSAAQNRKHNKSGFEQDMELDIARRLNERTNDPEFRKLWEWATKEMYFEAVKDRSHSEDQRYMWHFANQAQLINDVMLFADAGRLEDLEAVVDAYSKNLSDADVDNIKSMLSSSPDLSLRNKNSEEVREWVGERAEELKQTIRDYKDDRDAMVLFAGKDASEDYIKELLYTRMQLNSFERRYKSLYDEVMKDAVPILNEIAQEVDGDGLETERAKKARAALGLRGDPKLYGLSVIDALEDLQEFAADDETKQKISDMGKILESRRDFYTKLHNPMFKHFFAEQMADIQKKVKSLSKKASDSRVSTDYDKLSSANSLGEFFNMYANLPMMSQEDADSLDEKLSTSPKTKAFLKEVDRAGSMFEKVGESIDTAEAKADAELKGILSRIAKAVQALDMQPIMDSHSPANRIEVEIANALVDSLAGDDDAQTTLINLLQNTMGDMMQSLSLGRNDGKVDEPTPEPEPMPEPMPEPAPIPEVEPEPAPEPNPVPADIPEPEPGEVGNGGTEVPVEIPGVSTEGPAATAAQAINDAEVDTDPDLIAIAGGDFSSFPEVKDQGQKVALMSAAGNKLMQLRRESGDAAVGFDDGKEAELSKSNLNPDEKPTTDERQAMRKKANEHLEMGSFKITPFQVYSYGKAKIGQKVVYSPMKDSSFRGDDKTRVRTEATLNWFRTHGVQEFIDSGALAALQRAYREEHGEDLPIYFLANPDWKKGNLANNPFVEFVSSDAKGNVTYNINMVMAVEMNDENMEFIEDFFSKKGLDVPGAVDKRNFIAVKDSAGNDVQYQVIGVIDQQSPQEIERLHPAEEDPVTNAGYKAVRTYSNWAWEYTIGRTKDDGIRGKYEQDKKDGVTFPNEGKWYVAEHPQPVEEGDNRVYTTLNYIQSGRNETREAGIQAAKDEPGKHKIPLRESLRTYDAIWSRDNDGRLVPGGRYFAIATNDGMKYSSENALADKAKFPDHIHAPLGSLWMATREANGAWAWTYVTIAQTNDASLSWDGTRQNFILKQLEKVFDASDSVNISDRIRAAHNIQSILYLGPDNRIDFGFDEGKFALNIAGAVCTNVAEAVTVLTNKPYRFQVSVADDLQDEDRMQDLIDSGVLSSEMRSFIRIGASAGVNFLVFTDEKGERINQAYPAHSSENKAITAGQDASITAVRDGSISNVRIGDYGYKLKEDGSVVLMGQNGADGESVTNPGTVAMVKGIVELMQLQKTNRFDQYGGKRYVFEDTAAGYTTGYTELFEKEIDGITVRLSKEGKSGSIQPVSDLMWNSMIKEAKEVGITFRKREISDAELMAQFDKVMAEEEGGKPKEKRKEKGRRPISAKKSVDKTITPKGTEKTADAANKEVQKDKENSRC